MPFAVPVLSETAFTASLETVFTAAVTAFAAVFVAVFVSPSFSTTSRIFFSLLCAFFPVCPTTCSA